jgi:SAM-dependent methyltransferase
MSAAVLRAEDGAALPLDPVRWHGATSAPERDLLARLSGPVLDVGCGPGRLLEGLARRGLFGLGVDPAPAAVALARRRGCSVLQRSVFEPLPGEGRWGSVLLLDGNIGIGGDPIRLLTRCRSLLRANGTVVAEVEPPGTGWRSCRARLERGAETGPWFEWAVVAAEALPSLAASAGLYVDSVSVTGEGRWFADLVGPMAARACA